MKCGEKTKTESVRILVLIARTDSSTNPVFTTATPMIRGIKSC